MARTMSQRCGCCSTRCCKQFEHYRTHQLRALLRSGRLFSKSTKPNYKATTTKETVALSFSTTEIGVMAEYEMFDHFLEKCQEGLNLPEMLDEQISVCKRDLIQTKGGGCDG